MNQPQPKPIHCQKCGKVLLTPTEMGEYFVKCEVCNVNWLVRVDIKWKYYQEFNKKVGIENNKE